MTDQSTESSAPATRPRLSLLSSVEVRSPAGYQVITEAPDVASLVLALRRIGRLADCRIVFRAKLYDPVWHRVRGAIESQRSQLEAAGGTVGVAHDKRRNVAVPAYAITMAGPVTNVLRMLQTVAMTLGIRPQQMYSIAAEPPAGYLMVHEPWGVQITDAANIRHLIVGLHTFADESLDCHALWEGWLMPEAAATISARLHSMSASARRGGVEVDQLNAASGTAPVLLQARLHGTVAEVRAWCDEVADALGISRDDRMALAKEGADFRPVREAQIARELAARKAGAVGEAWVELAATGDLPAESAVAADLASVLIELRRRPMERHVHVRYNLTIDSEHLAAIEAAVKEAEPYVALSDGQISLTPIVADNYVLTAEGSTRRVSDALANVVGAIGLNPIQLHNLGNDIAAGRPRALFHGREVGDERVVGVGAILRALDTLPEEDLQHSFHVTTEAWLPPLQRANVYQALEQAQRDLNRQRGLVDIGPELSAGPNLPSLLRVRVTGHPDVIRTVIDALARELTAPPSPPTVPEAASPQAQQL